MRWNIQRHCDRNLETMELFIEDGHQRETRVRMYFIVLYRDDVSGHRSGCFNCPDAVTNTKYPSPGPQKSISLSTDSLLLRTHDFHSVLNIFFPGFCSILTSTRNRAYCRPLPLTDLLRTSLSYR